MPAAGSDRSLELRVRAAVDDLELTQLHARAFGYEPGPIVPWGQRLRQHSLTWVCAFSSDALVGFVNSCWDGGAHAFVLDTVVDPDHQRLGIGVALVRTLAAKAAGAGCEWLHVDYERHLARFYRDACGFRDTETGLLSLHH